LQKLIKTKKEKENKKELIKRKKPKRVKSSNRKIGFTATLMETVLCLKITNLPLPVGRFVI
jgi:hypothetical protein